MSGMTLSPWDEALETAVRLHAQRSRIAVVAVPHFLWTDGSGPINLHRLRSVPKRNRFRIISADNFGGV